MTSGSNRSKITSDHLARKAVVYLRQSSDRQVKNNHESQRLQYALADRARQLGWEQVEIIDTDLGSSASAGAGVRAGFERLVASVALGEVGIVLSREVSRLARTDKDWCHLTEVCQVFATLIGDGERVYDLDCIDDQLVLGIKATMSVVELKVLRQRLLDGVEAKAQRGQLFTLIPVGYVRGAIDQVVKDPDQRAQGAIRLVFEKFRETRSVRQTYLWFQDHTVQVPANKCQGGRMTQQWQLPTRSFLQGVLQNPFYAGAYVWGRRERRSMLVNGRLEKRTGRVFRAEECRVFLPDHHEGYIDWESFEETQQMIRSNSLRQDTETDQAAAAVRAGQGLLGSVLRCGRCGRKLHVQYRGRSGTSGRYLCKGDFEQGGQSCLAFSGKKVDQRFCEELLDVLSPLGMAASLEAIERNGAADAGQRQALVRQLEHGQYEATRAFEQYNEVDPRNRLVAAELERRWNVKLEEVEQLQGALAQLDAQRRPLREKEREQLLQLGQQFSRVWNSEHCSVEIKKRIIRTVVNEVIVDLDDAGRTLEFVIHWNGGTHTRYEMPKPIGPAGQKTSMDDIDLIRRMAPRYGDNQIAAVLSRLGRQTATGKSWTEQRVAAARRRHAIPGQRRSKPDPDILSMTQAAKHCAVGLSTIKRLVDMGVLSKEQVAPWAPWEIRREDLDSPEVREALERLRKTGKLGCGGVLPEIQPSLF